MSKKILFYLFTMLTFANANNIEREIGMNIGVNSTENEETNRFKNPTVGIFYQDNKYVISPRIDLDYTNLNNYYADSLVKASVNGVYEYENSTYTIPYLLAGLGYEYVDGSITDIFESHPFVQAGLGVRIDLEQGFKVRVETKALKILGGNNEGNEFIITAGLSMPLSSQSKVQIKPNVIRQRPKEIVRPIVIQPQPRVEPQVVYINQNSCPIKISAPDLDRDGIRDSVDQCPDTPCHFIVDSYGCPIKTTLKIHFATNSWEISPKSRFEVNQFAQFLLQNKGSKVKITGHTDNRGSAKANLVLSEKRANAVVHALTSLGVSAYRLEAIGRGESQPIASNTTSSGRAKNRRIEAELFYPKRKR